MQNSCGNFLQQFNTFIAMSAGHFVLARSLLYVQVTLMKGGRSHE
jgi:hypothetical protein